MRLLPEAITFVVLFAIGYFFLTAFEREPSLGQPSSSRRWLWQGALFVALGTISAVLTTIIDDRIGRGYHRLVFAATFIGLNVVFLIPYLAFRRWKKMNNRASRLERRSYVSKG